jgi:hypothetical protein
MASAPATDVKEFSIIDELESFDKKIDITNYKRIYDCLCEVLLESEFRILLREYMITHKNDNKTKNYEIANSLAIISTSSDEATFFSFLNSTINYRGIDVIEEFMYNELGLALV